MGSVIGIDTNALLRWLAPELGDEGESEVVDAAIRTTGDPIYVNSVVLAETLWVFGRKVGAARADQARLIGALLSHPRVVVAAANEVAQALGAFESGGPGFADHLIGALNAAAGCRTTLTFDRGAAGGPHFTLLS